MASKVEDNFVGLWLLGNGLKASVTHCVSLKGKVFWLGTIEIDSGDERGGLRFVPSYWGARGDSTVQGFDLTQRRRKDELEFGFKHLGNTTASGTGSGSKGE